MTVGAKRLVEESLFFVSLFSRTHTCDTFLNPNREIWNFWSGNLCLVSGGFHVANFGPFLPKLKSRNLVTLLEDTGYPHDGRADKDSYPHDGRADKDSYPHDGRADKDSYPHDRHNQYIMLSL